MPNVPLPETIKRETYTLRNMAADLARRTTQHNRKIRAHIRRLMADGSAYVLVQVKDQSMPAKVIGPVGANRAMLEFIDGVQLNTKLENIIDCIGESEFNLMAEAVAKDEQAATAAAKERLNAKR